MRVRADVLRWVALAACAAAWTCGAADVPLGRLFYTPEERERLDRQRRGDTHEAAAAPGAARSAGEVTGFVKRSDGRNTVWIDGQPMPARTPGASQLLDPRGVRAYADRQQGDLRIERRPPR